MNFPKGPTRKIASKTIKLNDIIHENKFFFFKIKIEIIFNYYYQYFMYFFTLLVDNKKLYLLI